MPVFNRWIDDVLPLNENLHLLLNDCEFISQELLFTDETVILLDYGGLYKIIIYDSVGSFFLVTNTLITPHETIIRNLREFVLNINEKILLTSVVFVKAESNNYIYEIQARDGRLWRQELTIDNFSDPLMTFNVLDKWRLSEFSLQRNLRSLLINLITTHQLIRFEMELN